ncbi:hypothetical protein H7A76_12630 [Pseudomonas sp. MSSRFD41]|nr:hypothetical protein [Pseudomonas sp. MSSRFD41]MBC2656282.1 hypothetical protein [Pseudomonas sp. MSSRFD41]
MQRLVVQRGRRARMLDADLPATAPRQGLPGLWQELGELFADFPLRS